MTSKLIPVGRVHGRYYDVTHGLRVEVVQPGAGRAVSYEVEPAYASSVTVGTWLVVDAETGLARPAPGTVVGHAMRASVPRADGTSEVTIQIGSLPNYRERMDEMFDSLLAHPPITHFPTRCVLVPMPAAEPAPAPRCPSCDGTRLRRTDHGAHYCGGCSWHGATLTAPPPAARFGVGAWVRLTSPALGAQYGLVPAQSAAAYQVMRVNVDGSGTRVRREPGATRCIDDAHLTLCEAPR